MRGQSLESDTKAAKTTAILKKRTFIGSTSPMHDQPLEPDTKAATTTPSLKKRTFIGSLWTLVGYGINQVLRLASNLFLTRQLYPEAFGLMALVQTFLIGLELFSDVGIIPNIIQNKRGDEPAFLNTAWTIQVIRGVALWLFACLLAFPAASFYHEPLLVQLLPIAGLTSLIGGFASTKLATANRQLALGRLTLIEVGSYCISLVVMAAGAWLYRSVWALVVGGLVGTLAKTIASHIFLEGERNYFFWNREAFQALHRFGRWIFISTLLGFLAGQGDRLLVGKLLDVRLLGIYTIALTLSGIAILVVEQIGNRVLFASFAELERENPERVYQSLRKSRLTLNTLTAGVSIVLFVLGKPLISVMYDARYQEAGWMLQILTIGLLARALGSTYGDALLAKGKVAIISLLLVISVTFQFSSMILGHSWGGYHGLIIGIAVSQWLTYVSDAICFSRLSLWQPEIDLPIVGLAGAMAGAVYWGIV